MLPVEWLSVISKERKLNDRGIDDVDVLEIYNRPKHNN